MAVSGNCAPGFEPLREAFEALFTRHGEIGAALSITIAGETVVDLWGGRRQTAPDLPWERETVANVWSTTKGVAAACVAILVSRGRLAYTDPVARHWPAFAAEGKAAITVAQLLSHQAGLCGFRRPLQLDELYDSAARADELAAMAPLWTPCDGSGYHAITVGFLVDELVYRVDGRRLAQFVEEELREGAGLNLFIGLPAARASEAATLYSGNGEGAVSPPVLDPVQLAALANPVIDPLAPNSAPWRAASIPSANGFAGAPSLARLYAALAGDGCLAGREWVTPPVRAAMREVQCSGTDRVLGLPARWGCGFLVNSLGLYGPNPEAFGHSGWGGSFAFGDPAHALGCAYVMNRMGSELVGDPRAVSIVETLYRTLDGARG